MNTSQAVWTKFMGWGEPKSMGTIAMSCNVSLSCATEGQLAQQGSARMAFLGGFVIHSWARH